MLLLAPPREIDCHYMRYSMRHERPPPIASEGDHMGVVKSQRVSSLRQQRRQRGRRAVGKGETLGRQREASASSCPVFGAPSVFLFHHP